MRLDALHVFASLAFAAAAVGKYTADWDSLDARPLPSWYDEAKFGIFCHWGVYSVPAFRSEWLWWYWKGKEPDPNVVAYIDKNYKPGTTYADFAKDFTAELFDPKEFVDIVSAAGAKYFVLTSKHHEGFALWPTKTSWNWNSVDIGPKRDLVGALKDAFKGTDIHYGLYFSQFEWFNPLFLDDGLYNTTLYPDQISYPQMIELVSKYKPEVVWSDGEWDKTDDYWRSKTFLAWLYNSSPVKNTVVVNDRWGSGTLGKHGGFFTYADRYDPGKLLERKWENCLTLDKEAWGSEDVMTTFELIEQIARTAACNGNVLLNIGPDMHGRIAPVFEDRLRDLGSYLGAHKEALYGTKPWIYQNDTSAANVWYTSRYRDSGVHEGVFNAQLKKQTVVYAWVLDTSPEVFELSCIHVTDQTRVTFLSTNVTLALSASTGRTLKIRQAAVPWRLLQRRDAFVLKIEYAASETRNPLAD